MTDPLAVLQRIRTAPPPPAEPVEERCELCAEPIDTRHGHLVDLSARTLLCGCRGCYLLFTVEGAGGGHFRAVPEGVKPIPASALTTRQWESLQIPVSVAFFFFNSSLGRIAAFYPGPAGATESELPLDTWREMVATTPQLESLAPDVEALLVRVQRGQEGIEGYVVPIDACYELVGHLRRQWRGFDGGSEARHYIDGLFASLRDRAR